MVLGLFFSRGVSLQLWVEKGLFDREKLLYEAHLKRNTFEKIYWFTYGSNDKSLSILLKNKNKLDKNIEIIEMPKFFNIPKIGSYIYSFFLPFIQKKYLKECSIYKTNQTDGSWSGVMAKKLYSKKLLYRTGYTISQLENQLKRFNIIIRKIIEIIEKLAYGNCDKATVASCHNLEYVIKKYKIDKEKIQVIYNFIDRDRFFNFKDVREDKVVFVGRLSDEKNIFNLIVALNKVNLPLEIYGSGPLKKEIQKIIKEHNYSVTLMGNVSNNDLPEILNRSKYYALVSKHEGMPKALIEAMACGCLCIGTDVSGINEVIKNNNGILASNPSSSAIENAFNKAKILSLEEAVSIKNKAQETIDNLFILESIVEKESKILKSIVKVKENNL